MINKIQAVINQIISFVRSIKASAKLTPLNSIFTEKSKLQNNSENYSIDEHIRMEAPNLLSSIEEVITDDFCVLSNSDTLSDALALITIQGASEIIIVDRYDKFAGFIRDISVLREVPPLVSDVPVSRRLKSPKIRRQLSDDLVNTLKRPIGEVFKLEKIQRRFSKNQRLIYALEELSQPYNYYTQPRVIPIFNNNETVAGIVSPVEILKYIKSDISFGELKVEQLLSEEFHLEELYKLLPSDTLDKAYFAMKYLSVDYIMICDDNSDLLGIVERHQVIALTHPMYYELMDMPLVEIMKPMDKLYLVESSQIVEEIIASFLELGIGAAIAVDRSASQVRPKMVITPITILQLCLKNFRQNRK